MKVPMTAERSIVHFRAKRFAMLGSFVEIFIRTFPSPNPPPSSALERISPTAKAPMMAGMKLIPSGGPWCRR